MPSDQYHQRALAERAQLIQQGVDPLVPYPLLMESYRLVLRRVAPSQAHAWLDEVPDRSVLFTPLEVDLEQALQRVRRYRDQPLTLTDCLLAVLSERLTLPVWSFDHHFDILRVPRWPQAS